MLPQRQQDLHAEQQAGIQNVDEDFSFMQMHAAAHPQQWDYMLMQLQHGMMATAGMVNRARQLSTPWVDGLGFLLARHLVASQTNEVNTAMAVSEDRLSTGPTT